MLYLALGQWDLFSDGVKLRNCHPNCGGPSKRADIAKELGATHALDSKAEDLVEQIIDLSKGGVDFSIEASGSPTAVDVTEMLAVQVGSSSWSYPAQTYQFLTWIILALEEDGGYGRRVR